MRTLRLYENEAPADFILPLIFKKIRAIQTVAAFAGRTIKVACLYQVRPDEIHRVSEFKRGCWR